MYDTLLPLNSLKCDLRKRFSWELCYHLVPNFKKISKKNQKFIQNIEVRRQQVQWQAETQSVILSMSAFPPPTATDSPLDRTSPPRDAYSYYFANIQMPTCLSAHLSRCLLCYLATDNGEICYQILINECVSCALAFQPFLLKVPTPTPITSQAPRGHATPWLLTKTGGRI